MNVTKQTIVNNAKSLNISFKKENGINYINDNDCLKIIEKITKKERTMQNKELIQLELPEEYQEFKEEEGKKEALAKYEEWKVPAIIKLISLNKKSTIKYQ